MAKSLGILTGGGDCPGLNAVIRAVVRRADAAGWDVVAVREGWRGLVESYQSGEELVANPLSPREREVLQLVAEGKTTKEVAAALGISFKTAETHRANIMAKLDIHETAGLVRYAIRNRLIQV